MLELPAADSSRSDSRDSETPPVTRGDRRAAATVDDMIGIGFFPDEVGLAGVPVLARAEASR